MNYSCRISTNKFWHVLCKWLKIRELPFQLVSRKKCLCSPLITVVWHLSFNMIRILYIPERSKMVSTLWLMHWTENISTSPSSSRPKSNSVSSSTSFPDSTCDNRFSRTKYKCHSMSNNFSSSFSYAQETDSWQKTRWLIYLWYHYITGLWVWNSFWLFLYLTLLRSKMLFKSRSKAVEHLRICVTFANCSLVRQSSDIRMSSSPITAAIGVRSSWLHKTTKQFRIYKVYEGK